MVTVRCPQCGSTNSQDDIGYPLCGQCHQDLVLCTTCRHGEGSGCSHPTARAFFTGDMAHAKRCPEFRSAHEERRPRILWNIPAPVWVSALLLALMLALFGVAWFIDPANSYFRGNPVRLETVVPAEVQVGQLFWVRMHLTNPLNRPSTHIYIAVEKEFLAVADPGIPLPTPERLGPDRNRYVLQYPPLPAGESEIIQIPFIPRRSGQVTFSAEVYAPSHRLQHTVKVPITVSQASDKV